MTETYHSEFLMRQDIKKKKREGWVVSVKIHYPDGSYKVTYVKKDQP